MIYIFILFILASGYYTFSFGIFQYKNKNKLGGLSTMAVALIGTILPAYVLIIKNI
jgi:hypothetical protein